MTINYKRLSINTLKKKLTDTPVNITGYFKITMEKLFNKLERERKKKVSYL
jgi:hypothetical protein